MASKNQNKRQSRQVPRLSREEGFNVEEEQKRTQLPPMPEKEEHPTAKETAPPSLPSLGIMGEVIDEIITKKSKPIKQSGTPAKAVEHKKPRETATQFYTPAPEVTYTEEEFKQAKARYHQATVEYTRYKRRVGLIGKSEDGYFNLTKDEQDIVLEDLENVFKETDANLPPEYKAYLEAKKEYNKIKRWFNKDKVKERYEANAKEYQELKDELMLYGYSSDEVDAIADGRRPFESKASALRRYVEENPDALGVTVSKESIEDNNFFEPDETTQNNLDLQEEEERYGQEIQSENLSEEKISEIEDSRKFHERMVKEYPQDYPDESDIFYYNMETIINDSTKVVFPELQQLLIEMLTESRNSPKDFRNAMFEYNSMPAREVDQMLRFLLYYMESPLDADKNNTDYLEIANDYMERIAKMLFVEKEKRDAYLEMWSMISDYFMPRASQEYRHAYRLYKELSSRGF